MLRGAKSFLSGLAVVLLVVMAAFGLQASAAAADMECNERGQCKTVIEDEGESGDGNTGEPAANLKPGPSACVLDGHKVPCKTDLGVWMPSKGCYIKLDDEQDAPPAGQTALDGAWYVTTCVAVMEECSGAMSLYRDVERLDEENMLCAFGLSSGGWRNTPPPGINTLTPGQAARILIDSFQLEGPAFTTSAAGRDSGAVGLPVWLWVPEDKREPLNWGPYSKSSTLGGVTVTAEARITSVVYRMGDGGEVTCNGPGTPYTTATTRDESPDCGYTYTQMSPSEGDEPYEVEALARWTVSWSGAGQSGEIVTYAESTAPAHIGEIQVVNVPVG